MSAAPAAGGRSVVVVGASVAGVRCATALRDQGFTGSIVLLDAEDEEPYDKPQLSKRLRGSDQLDLLAAGSALRDRGIDLRTGVAARGLDLAAGVVQTSHGRVPFDELVIATGCRPRPLPYPLPDRAGYVRTRQDRQRLTEALGAGGRLLVVGAGFLGLEVAAAAAALGSRTTVVDTAPRVLTRGVPQTAATLIAERHTAEGVELRLGLLGPVLAGDAEQVSIDGVAGDYALVSIGAVPNVEWLAGSGLPVDDGVVCDAHLAAAPGVWAIGDCARWTNLRYDRPERHEHWTTAVRHAQHVARSIATGVTSPMREVTYVWSDQFDWRVQSVGRTTTDELSFSSPDGAHLVLCLSGDHVTGVTGINAQARCLRARRLLQDEDPPVDAVVAALGLAQFAPTG